MGQWRHNRKGSVYCRDSASLMLGQRAPLAGANMKGFGGWALPEFRAPAPPTAIPIHSLTWRLGHCLFGVSHRGEEAGDSQQEASSGPYAGALLKGERVRRKMGLPSSWASKGGPLSLEDRPHPPTGRNKLHRAHLFK